MPSHSHAIKLDNGNDGGVAKNAGTGSSQSNDYTQYTGGNQAHNNMPPFLAINFIIKYK